MKNSSQKNEIGRHNNKSGSDISPEATAQRRKLFREIAGIALVFLALFVFLCILLPKFTGIVGEYINYAFKFWFGLASYVFPIIIIYIGLSLTFRKTGISPFWIILAGIILYLDFSIFFNLVRSEGGFFGKILSLSLANIFGIVGTYILSIALSLIMLMILTQISLKQVGEKLGQLFSLIGRGIMGIYSFLAIKHEETGNSKLLKVPDLSSLEERKGFQLQKIDIEEEEPGKTQTLELVRQQIPSSSEEVLARMGNKKDSASYLPSKIASYKLPSLDLLRTVDVEEEETSARDYSQLLEETLMNFGVEVKVIDKVRGPTVTRYELQPAKGVKVKKVTNLVNDIALALAAYSIRIEAPIPGKSAIGIEVPNHRIDPVFLRDILSEAKYKKQPPLSLALGKDITGKAIMDDLLKMPHLLIAGATGSGKSVCINCIIGSILYKSTPLEVQLVMIDPKRVELSPFEGIPHLVDIKLPGGKKIITDPKAATSALHTISGIMDQRYEDFVAMKVRNIKEFNEKSEVPIPYVIVLIDELADLMMISSSTVEQYICRIAQLGRASGIHLIVATQRPSVDVITGLIKANIPSRIAFAVSSQVDSRVIIDRVGAEKLLGKGDMLYLPVDANEPRRIQGAYVSGEEMDKLVEFWREQPPPENAIPIEITEPAERKEGESMNNEEQDSLINEAIEVIRSSKQASVSNLQRKMKIGYARAGRIMDQLEKMGIVGPAEGSKPRKILLPGFMEMG